MRRSLSESDETAAGNKLAASRPNGIPTVAFGYRFRSRLEAKWAHMFTALGWRWEYEPLDLNGWIPDFLIHTAGIATLVEIKPESTIRDLSSYVAKIERGLGGARYEVLLLGCTAFPFPDHNEVGYDPIGLLGEFFEDSRTYDEAKWMRCLECGTVSFFHSTQSFRSRVCGHYDGDHFLAPVLVSDVEGPWAAACNATQWRP